MVFNSGVCWLLGFDVVIFENHAYQVCCTQHLGDSKFDKHGFCS